METKLRLLEIHESLINHVKNTLVPVSASALDRKMSDTYARLDVQIRRTLRVIGVLNVNLLCQAWVYSRKNVN